MSAHRVAARGHPNRQLGITCAARDTRLPVRTLVTSSPQQANFPPSFLPPKSHHLQDRTKTAPGTEHPLNLSLPQFPFSTSTFHSTPPTIASFIRHRLRTLPHLRSLLPRGYKHHMEFLSRFNPIPQFPAYKGAYNVGSIDLEIPVSSLSDANTRTPEPAKGISTIQFRIFYPTSYRDATKGEVKHPTGTVEHDNEEIETSATEGKGMAGWASSWFTKHQGAEEAKVPEKPVYWLPEPHQREYLSGYARFLGARSGLAELISWVFPPSPAKIRKADGETGIFRGYCIILRCRWWSLRRS